MDSPSVLIVGAGPTGLILALSLLQNGVSVRIIDKVARNRTGQRGAGIMPRSFEVFRTLGVVNDIEKDAMLSLPVALYDPTNGAKMLYSFEMSPYVKPTPSCPYMNLKHLGQDHLEGILRSALEKHGCSVELNTELLSFDQNEDGVTARIAKWVYHHDHHAAPDDGHEPSLMDREETATFQYLVGADGARGTTRKLLGLSFLGETRHMDKLVVGDIRVKGLSRDYWHMWGDVSNVLVSLRPTEVHDVFNFTLTGRGINHKLLAEDPKTLLEILETTIERDDLEFGEIVWISHYSPNIRMVDKLNVGRVFIAGDAAHVHSPTGGQGMNSGVLDAFNLGWKLALLQKNLSTPSLLTSYGEERLPVIKEMLKQTTALLDKTFEEQSQPQTPKPGDTQTHNQNQSDWSHGGSLLQLGVNCRWSSIVLDEQSSKGVVKDDPIDSYGVNQRYGGTLSAGDRSRDAPGLINARIEDTDAPPIKLFSILGSSYHTVLILPDTDRQEDRAPPYPSVPILTALAAFPLPKDAVRTAIIREEEDDAHDDVHDASITAAADLIFEDRRGYAYDAYDLSDGCYVVVIRPDGVVGAIVSGVEGLEKYFRGVFRF